MSSSAKKIVKKSTTKYRSKKPIVPKWKLFRANEPFMSIFMWGINHSICELSHVPPPTLLLPDDFKAFSKVKIDNHAFNKDNMPSHFKIKEYCPNVFRNLREKFGIQEHDYLKSLTKSQPEVMESSGKSQAKFYFSYDGSLVVKSLCAEEVAEVHSILQDYHEYVVEKRGQTLLPQFLGLYRLTVESVETYLIVMRNIFGQRYSIHKKYDLKGSTVQRCASDKEKVRFCALDDQIFKHATLQQKELPTYKDVDFIEDGCKLYLPEDAGKTLIKLLTADCEFLSKLRLMDYSVLVGIHECAKSPPPNAVAPPTDEVFNTGGGGGGDSSEPDVASLNMSDDDLICGSPPRPQTGGGAGGQLPSSPPPAQGGGVFPTNADDFNLDDEFYAVASRSDAPKKEIYFIGLVDILTYYGMKKKTASAAKTVKYGAAEAENISTVKPHQYARRLIDFINKSLDPQPQPMSISTNDQQVQYDNPPLSP